MKRLPSEIWTIIAQHTKRPQPPPKVKANWNDDFNQQDLVSLMCVDKVISSLRGIEHELTMSVDVQGCRPYFI